MAILFGFPKEEGNTGPHCGIFLASGRHLILILSPRHLELDQTVHVFLAGPPTMPLMVQSKTPHPKRRKLGQLISAKGLGSSKAFAFAFQ